MGIEKKYNYRCFEQSYCIKDQNCFYCANWEDSKHTVHIPLRPERFLHLYSG